MSKVKLGIRKYQEQKDQNYELLLVNYYDAKVLTETIIRT
jgi:hypothetical protein